MVRPLPRARAEGFRTELRVLNRRSQPLIVGVGMDIVDMVKGCPSALCIRQRWTCRPWPDLESNGGSNGGNHLPSVDLLDHKNCKSIEVEFFNFSG